MCCISHTRPSTPPPDNPKHTGSPPGCSVAVLLLHRVMVLHMPAGFVCVWWVGGGEAHQGAGAWLWQRPCFLCKRCGCTLSRPVHIMTSAAHIVHCAKVGEGACTGVCGCVGVAGVGVGVRGMLCRQLLHLGGAVMWSVMDCCCCCCCCNGAAQPCTALHSTDYTVLCCQGGAGVCGVVWQSGEGDAPGRRMWCCW